jgi:hypothetical protein
MSGYLQRLVQTAAQPVQSVHPFAGSIFAPVHDDQRRGVESEEFVIATSEINAPARSTSKQQNLPERKTRPNTVPLREYRPIAQVGAITLLQSEGETNALPFHQEQFLQPPRSAAKIKETDTEQLPAHLTTQPEFHPLLAQEAVVAETQLAHAPPRAKTRAPSDNRRSSATERASDDIQIHIGRIEVTAVHPPAPRTAKTPDRGPSLDAYLNRRVR